VSVNTNVLQPHPSLQKWTTHRFPGTSGVARIWCEEGHETKRKQFKDDTQKYDEIHAVNSDKSRSLMNIFTG